MISTPPLGAAPLGIAPPLPAVRELPVSNHIACPDCIFYGPRVGTKGPENSPLVIVGESPGKEELKYLKPFVGPTGFVLDETLSETPLKDHKEIEPYFINALQCWPGKAEDKDPADMARAVAICRPRLLQQIQKYPRKVIIAQGNPALWSLTNNYNLKITRERGKLFASPYAEVGLLASVHPAYLLRGNGSLRQFRADIDYGVRLALGEPIRGPNSVTWSELTDESQIEAMAIRFRERDVDLIASDVETDGLDHLDNQMLCAGFTYDGRHVYIVPEHLIGKMNPLFQNKKRFGWHNGKFDVKFCHNAGVVDARVDEDSMLISYTLDEQRGIHDLEQVSGDWLNSPNWKAQLKPYLPNRSTSYRAVPRPILHKYMAFDIANTWNLIRILRPKVANDTASENLYTRILIPGSKYLAQVEKRGALVDPIKVAENKKRLQGICDQYEAELNEISQKYQQKNINPNSPIQVAELLYDAIKIKSATRSTDKDVLKHLGAHPSIKVLMRYRQARKALSTYVLILDTTQDSHAVSSDKRVHTTFLLHGTPTGRLASRDPNMQNIPRDPQIRGQFIAPDDRVLIEVDLNQAELRSLACLSGDKVLCQIYETEGMSLHEVTRRSIYDHPDNYSLVDWARYQEEFHCDREHVLGEQKMRAKAVNFGIVYGREAPSLAEEFEMPVEEGQRWVNAWFKTYPEAHNFIEVCRRAPIKNMNLKTVFGRRRRCRIVTQQTLKNLQNECANFPHQSIAADITNSAGIETYEDLKRVWDTYIWDTVHDSNLMDTPDSLPKIVGAAQLMKQTMEAIPPKVGLTRIKFKADIKVGKRWGSLEDWEKWYPKRLELEASLNG